MSRHSPLSLDLWTSTQGIQQLGMHILISVLLTEKWAHLQSIPSGLPDSRHPYSGTLRQAYVFKFCLAEIGRLKIPGPGSHYPWVAMMALE